MLQLGLESGDQAVLDALGKGTRIDEIAKALGNLRGVSIGVYLYVLFGTPVEDRGAAMRTRDFLASAFERDRFPQCTPFSIFPFRPGGVHARD